MQKLARAARSCREILKFPVLNHFQIIDRSERRTVSANQGSEAASEAKLQNGLEDITVTEVLMTKGEERTGSWLWCRTNDYVCDAIKNMARHNIGSLVVLKPGDERSIAGIITERDCIKKIIGEERSSKYTRVGEIMTDQKKLITVSSDTNILRAMQLMTENDIRHAPVIDGKIVGMISMVDIVQAVLQHQNGELNRLNEFIRGKY